MESRLQLDSRIHFFEYYSLDKFEESLRNALLYSIDIITQTDRFVHLHQFSKEIALCIEIAINIPYSLKYNASYSEYFYGFSLSNKQNWIQRVGILILRLLYPYLMLKFSNYINQHYQGKWKTILQYVLKAIKLTDLLIKFKYLLDEDFKYYSLFYIVIRQELQRNKIESPYKHLMILVFLFFKFLDYYYQKQPKQVKNSNELIQPPQQIKPENVQQYCPKCMRIPIIPAVFKTNGYVYCLECLQSMAFSNQITNDHIIKIYQ